jgi:hypothetical protein
LGCKRQSGNIGLLIYVTKRQGSDKTNEVRLKSRYYTIFFENRSIVSFLKFFVVIFLLNFSTSVSAQTPHETESVSLPDVMLFAEASGFIPFRESYRINYQTSLAGIPIEVAGGICFPLNESLSGMLEVRYKRRAEKFVQDFRIKTLEIELGMRDYLERRHDNDLRLFGSAGLLLARSTVSGNIEATPDGKDVIITEVSKDYYNIGLGLGLGIEYPVTKISGIYAVVNIGIYFADPVASGGLGNIGGLSIGLGYKINID